MCCTLMYTESTHIGRAHYSKRFPLKEEGDFICIHEIYCLDTPRAETCDTFHAIYTRFNNKVNQQTCRHH